MEGNTKILDRIRKLFALSTSPNEAEATAALEKAHELLRQYNLDIAQLSAEEESEIVEEPCLDGSRLPNWKKILVIHVTRENFCETYQKFDRVAYGYQRISKYYTFQIIGKPHNVVVAKEMLNYLFAAIDRLGRRYPGSVRNSYKAGVVSTLIERIHEASQKESTDPTNRALVVAEKALIKRFLDEKQLKNSRVSLSANSESAYMNGQRDGNTISLNSQISKNTSSGIVGYLSYEKNIKGGV